MTDGPAYKAVQLRVITARLDNVLETFFGGYYMQESRPLNDLYVLLVENLQTVAVPFPEVCAALDELRDFIPNLYEAIGHEDSPDENWEFGGQAALRRLKARVSEVWVSNYDGQAQLSPAEAEALTGVDELIGKCRAAKAAGWRRIEEDLGRAVKESRQRWEPRDHPLSQPTDVTVPVALPENTLQDKVHAACVEALVSKLRGEGHDAQPEGTYSRYGERGSVDVYYFDFTSSVAGCAIYEVWTQLDNLNAALRKLDEKSRVFPASRADERKSPVPGLTRAHFVVLATRQNMQLIGEHRQTFEAKFAGGLDDRRRFFLQAFDPVIQELETLLPGGGVDAAVLRKWSRFPSKQAFMEAWRKRRSSKETLSGQDLLRD